MFRKTMIASVVAAGLLASPLMAETISGVVTDENGQPVAGAEVTVIGENQRITTDTNGRFTVTNLNAGEAELHIEARRFGHRNFRFEVPAQGLSNISLTLLSSTIEVIDVTASPFHASATESSLPVSVLAGDALKMRQAATLGDTLKNEVGVHSNFYGNVASSPIIRGLDGPRVLITQNGLDAGDASRIGPDHSVASETSTATQIEVLRGPATLFYGSGAIGGVVNVVDERIPTDNTTRAEWMVQRESVNDEKLASGSLVSGVDNIGLYIDGFWRDNDSYRIPGFAEAQPDDDAVKGRVDNTAATAKGFTVGGSYLLDNGFVGLSYGRLDREYGIPGHAHDEHGAEEEVYADLSQNRYQLLSELNFSSGIIRAVNTKLAVTDYQHSEIEEGEIGTTFKNRSHEARVEILHRTFQDWRGGLSLHYKFSDFEALGEEAFTPPSETEMLALGWVEERHIGDWLLQLGARIERVTLKAPNVLLPELEVHGHDDAQQHEAEHGAETPQVFAVQQRFTPYSLSAGAVWDFADGYNLGLSVSHAERAPAAAELLSFGPHISTASYEIGALFVQDEHGFELNTQPVALEKSNNLDITLRKFSGNTGFVLNAFYNRIDNYYYQQNTGLFAEESHQDEPAAEHGDEHVDEHTDEMPVYLFAVADATLHGLEAQYIWQVNDPFKLTLQGDYIRARLNGGGDLPRTPPLRIAAELAYQQDAISADLRATRYFKQDKVAEMEQATAGYTLLDASVSYRFDVGLQELTLYLKGQNLTDQTARVHTSFLKDLAPLPGRSLALGVRGRF
ncbi:iron complex outermembrane recepter protein [Arsukibacterium tuosuense]|uniref:Iron complex outermembrane recepter protein n=1 Tax=Arsukibacterium tuosuense TaxID=1323745 RepID=A0A285IPL5_9GAMM|nr:TonB-dependent receptor [Arsukibacterium tuosuense]SNY49959.1 iron complex outermembrane recepter protein [Arsukibacterium tuosuense]